MTKSYTEQFDTVNRHFTLFKQINDGKTHNQPSLYRDDLVINFFQHCYHLKDWIKNDPNCATWSDVEKFINQNDDLKICADICNETKHLKLTKPRSAENPSLDVNDSIVKLVVKDGGNVSTSIDISVKYNVSIDSGDKDAFELAERCVLAWKSFISLNTHNP
jgi:hypothetical protein